MPLRPILRSRRRRRGCLAGAAVAGVLVGGLAGGCAAPPHHNAEGDVVLKFGDSFSATHPIGAGGVTPFIEKLHEEGPGVGLEVEYYANGQLGKQRDMVTLLRSGVMQVGPVSPAYVGTELPLSNVGDLPGLVSDACVGADAVLATMQQGGTLYDEELEPRGIRPLWVAVVPHYEAMTGEGAIAKPSDAEGHILRSTGGVADRVVDEVGAAGVSMPLGELYEAISRGTVEGTVASPVSIASYKLGEVLGFTTDGARLGAFTITFSISDDVWQELDAAQQELLLEASALAQQGACEAIEEAATAALTEMRDQGVEVLEIGPDSRAEWDALATPVRDKWVEDLESTGRPAARVLEEFEVALEEAAQ